MSHKRHVPPELESLIELANSVSDVVDLPQPHGRIDEVVEMLKKEPFRRFRELTGPIEPDACMSKLLGSGPPKTYFKVIGNYIRMRDGKAWLKQAALIAGLSVKMRYLMPFVSAQANERGELEFNFDPLVKALEGVEISRIRICPICGDLFWAARRDKPCCSIRCAKTRRVRLWRESNEIKYKDQRIKKKMERRKMKEQLERERIALQTTIPTKSAGRAPRLPKPRI